MPTNEISEVVFGRGHANIKATHPSTLEFTKDAHVSKNGDCILVVSMDKGLADLSGEFRDALRRQGAKLTVLIEADVFSEEVHAHGSLHLSLSDPVEMVIRKSDFTSNRTLAVHADKAAADLSRALVAKLQNPEQKVKITLTVCL